MGLCFSCCRRQRKDRGEREPLLPKHNGDVLPPPQTQFDKLADLLAALSAGKLPSQSQIDHALQSLLKSDILDARAAANAIGYGPLSESGRRVVEDVREVMQAALEVGVRKNGDDTLQDLLYQTRQISGPPVQADVAVRVNNSNPFQEDLETVADVLPSAEEVTSDAATVLGSLQQLSGLVLTSSTFRLLLADVLATARSVVADAAAEVGHVAAQVQGVAQSVEETARPGGEPIEQLRARAVEAAEEVGQTGEATRQRWERLARESPDRVRESVIGRVQNIIVRAQQTPTYRSALLTLLFISRKYVATLSTLSTSISKPSASSLAENPPVTLTPVIWTDPHLSRALTDLQALLERTASGHSLAPLLALLQRTLTDVLSAPGAAEADTRAFFADAGAWLQTALTRDGYAGSREATRAAESLYDRGRALFTAKDAEGRPTSTVGRDAQALFAQADELLGAFAADKSTHRLLAALDVLSADVKRFSTRAAAAGSREAARAAATWRAELTRDALGWLVPRLLRAAGAIPMPRVEFASPTLDAALDALLLTAPRTRGRTVGASASLLPDHVRVQNWSEVRLDVVREGDGGVVLASPLAGAPGVPAGYGGVQTATRVRVSLDGLRVAAHDVGYYVCYKPSRWLGYEDEGLVSLDVGREDRAGEGVRLELELEFDTSSTRTDADDSAPPEPLFRVLDVRADVPGLRFAIDRSKHWIVNKVLLQPLVAPIGRAVVKLLVARQVKTALEGVALKLGEAKRDVDRMSEKRGVDPEWADWWTALARRLASSTEPADEHDDADGNAGEEDPHAPRVETHTAPTAKGLVRTTVTQPDPEAAQPPPPETSTIAIGVGAQILPGKGGAHDAHGHADDYEGDGPAEVAREALDEVQGRVDDVERGVEGAVEEAVKVREEVDQAGARGTVRARLEAKREGWRSLAFDLW